MGYLSHFQLVLTYDERKEIDLVIPGAPNPRLISGASLDKPTPRVPSRVIMERVRVRVREVSHEQNSLTTRRVSLVMSQSPVRIMGLSHIP